MTSPIDPADAERLTAALARAWPGIPGDAVSSHDRERLLTDLGYLRYEPLRVLRRAASGTPAVVLSFYAPKDPDSISTNVFWITDPDLRASVDRLEATGAVSSIKDAVLADSPSAARLAEDHRAYHALVERLFDACLGRPPPKPEFGIGGVRALDQVKCLHAHLACFLGTGRSVVGERVAGMISWRPL
jgi:hypothetical protein